MQHPSLKYAVLLFITAILPFTVLSCSKGGSNAKAVVMKAIVKEEPPPLPPAAEALVSREFAGMGLTVTASDAREVSLESGSPGGAMRDAMVFTDPVFTKVSTDGYKTVLKGDNAVIDPAGKCVVFDKGASVEGPWDNRLEAGRLTWYYGRDELEASDGYTLANGSGISQGNRCKTDVSFRSIDVE